MCIRDRWVYCAPVKLYTRFESRVPERVRKDVYKRQAVIHDGIYDTGMHKVSIIANLAKFDQLKSCLLYTSRCV